MSKEDNGESLDSDKGDRYFLNVGISETLATHLPNKERAEVDYKLRNEENEHQCITSETDSDEELDL
jgi:hypothetical protein